MKPNDSKTRFDLVPFFHGRILDVSEGNSRAFPHFISSIDVGITDPDKCDLFTDGSMDGVLSSYVLHLLSESEAKLAITEWSRLIKNGGHLMLHVPQGDEGERWPVSYDSVVKIVSGAWDLVHYGERDRALLFVFKKGAKGFSHLTPKPEKTCAVVRYGAFGDCIQASSILPHLKADGYHITFYCSDHGYPVIEKDPHIDRFVIQGRDEVPPAVLHDFWEHEREKYDRWINLSESVEGACLALPGSSAFEWPNAVRAKYMDRNYLEFTHELAEVPPPYQPKFYSTPEEKLWARDKARSYGKRNILWSLSGSSPHKAWPHLDTVVAAIMLAYPDVHVVMVGDELSQVLETGWGGEKRIHKRSGEWTIRQSMAFAEVADLIIGTETGLLNAAGMMDTPKIVTLSHSSPAMLTKHWRNVTALTQPAGVGCAKYPCRQLHSSFDDCPRHVDLGTALCQASIGADQMTTAIVGVLGSTEKMAA